MEKLMKINADFGEFKYDNLFKIILLSFLTLGAYIGIWFLQRKDQIENLKSNSGIHFGLWRVFTVITFFFLLMRIFGNIFLTDYGMAYMQSFDGIFSFFFVGLLYYSIYRVKEVLEEKDYEFNNYLLFFFHVFYIQFKINQMHSKTDLLTGSLMKRGN